LVRIQAGQRSGPDSAEHIPLAVVNGATQKAEARKGWNSGLSKIPGIGVFRPVPETGIPETNTHGMRRELTALYL
jgi:hypothetical protein